MQIQAADGPLRDTLIDWPDGALSVVLADDSGSLVYRLVSGAAVHFPLYGDDNHRRNAWCAAVEAEVLRRIDEGFLFLPAGEADPLRFALAGQDQIMLLGLGASLPSGGVVPPIPVFTRDNQRQIVLATPDEVAAYLAAATLTVAGQREIGRMVKEAIRSAPTAVYAAPTVAAYLSGWTP